MSALIVVFGLLTTAASNVFSNIYHVYQAEIFPSDVRATAVGWTYSISRLSSAALPFILIPVLDHYGATTMFAVVLVALAATIAVLVPFGPRTTGIRKEPGRNQPDMIVSAMLPSAANSAEFSTMNNLNLLSMMLPTRS